MRLFSRRQSIARAAAAYLVAISASPLSAAITTVDPWHTAGNGNPTDFGGPWYNVPNVELRHRGLAAFGAGTFTANMVIQGVGFSDLQGVSYTGQPVADVSLLPTGGWAGGVSFYGFDLGVWQSPPLTRDVRWEVWNGDYSTRLAQGTVNVGATRRTVDVVLFSANGFHLQFESAGEVALDNYRVEGSASAAPDIAVAAGAPLTDGAGSVPLGVTIPGVPAAPVTFTITNPGLVELSGLTVTKSGAHAADFTVGALSATSLPVGNGSATFAVSFAPTAAGVKTATLQVASNAFGAKNPFDITLTARALSFTEDTDGDGMNDASEFQMSAFGFNWQLPQTGLVQTYYNAAPEAGLFTLPQLQTQFPGTPLVPRDPATGLFPLTLRVEKSTTLQPGSFGLFPVSEPPTSFSGGNILFQFPEPDARAFFRVIAE